MILWGQILILRTFIFRLFTAWPTHPTPVWPTSPCMSTPPHTTPPLYDPSPLYDPPTSLVGFWKFTDGYEGMCMSGGKFPEPWQVTIKLLSDFFFYNSYFTFYEWLKTQEITHMVSKIPNGYEGCVWVGGSFLNHDKWPIKLLSNFYAIHIQSFTNDSNSRNNNS